MLRNDVGLSETDIRSDQATTKAVRSDTADNRKWLVDAPVCPLLSQFHVIHLGLANMPSPFEIVRTDLAGSYFLACFGGEGRVLVDGRFRPCASGQAFLLPPGTLHAFHTPKSGQWDFCWIRFQEQPGQQPIADINSPVLATFDVHPLRLAIEGLHHECSHANVAAQVDHWVKLIQGYVLNFSEPRRTDSRIWQLWEQVSANLKHNWTSAEMASIVKLSEKQLERLCRRELGRTPRQQLIWLRMRRAAELLLEDGATVVSVSAQVGYENPFVFSTTFKRCMGWSPSEHGSRAS